MKLTQHAMLMIALPLALELMLAGVVFGLARNLNANSSRVATAQAVINCGEELEFALYSQSAAVNLMLSTDADFAYDRFLKAKQRAAESLARMEQLSQGNLDVQPDVLDLKRAAATTQAYLEASEHAASIKHIGNLEKRQLSLKQAYLAVATKVDNVLGRYRQYLLEVSTMEGKTVQSINIALIVGSILGIVLAVGLSFTFQNGIKRRLNDLLENLSSYGPEYGLPKGDRNSRDEITSIDSTFQSMARAIVDRTDQLRSAEVRVRLALDGLSVGVLILNEDYTIRYANPKFCRLVDGEPDTLTGKLVDSFIVSSKGAKLLDALKSADSDTVAMTDWLLVACNKKIPVELSSNSFAGPDGAASILSVQDVSDRHELERLRKELLAVQRVV